MKEWTVRSLSMPTTEKVLSLYLFGNIAKYMRWPLSKYYNL